MAGKQNPGVLGLFVEAQRRRQREQQAQQRAWHAAFQEQQKAHRAAHRAAIRANKEAWAAYQAAQEAEAARRTTELEELIGALGRILADGAALPPLHPAHLRTTAPAVPFQPGPLAQPISMPDPARYQVPSLPALQALHPAARREHAEQVARARSRYDHDCLAAQAAEADRRRRLDEAGRQHQAWLHAQQQLAAEHNARVDLLPQRLHAGEPAAIEEYFAAILYLAAGWPAAFPRNPVTAWDDSAKQLIIDWQLPALEVVPETTRIRYVKTTDEHRPITMPAGQRAALYRDVLCQSALRVVTDLFRADHFGNLASIAFNGYVLAPDPATGQDTERFLVSVMIDRAGLAGLNIAVVDAAACLRQLRAQISARPERLATVRPARRASGAPEAAPALGDDQDLYEMDPARFEDLVADLFRSRGLEVTGTGRAGDGGVDIEARDPDPITGGLIVIQVKRHRATIDPGVVRDLYGTVQHRGATKGILVTTSGFGPGSHEFARDKPLTLISGAELVDLLGRTGLSYRCGEIPT
ncbi:restriction endonuclease [Actinoplanes ianthinogenes]|uniref:Restriction endonuclease n=1 Tax=Actinoplanes ianthinogenes TaxID=122358 RepID=A0ABM7M6Y1_9ACTN|nr:restriction endonuclease [Actinoplanes ianthinogenes]BCJ47425.1 restriction endonuclease [Actinoplanes ianthinogenes]GGR01707.1 restriction endonuclease [Actinoplanes ianthinogenes]